MENKNKQISIKRIPLPFKMKKYKETDFYKHSFIIKLRKDKKSKTLTKIFDSNNENKKNIENQKIIENHNVKLRKHKTLEQIEFKKNNKKYQIIPIISHNSEKPSITLEEINGGKLYPSLYNFKNEKNYEKINKKELTEQKIKCDIKKKKFKIIPIIAHESEPPLIAFEEIDGGNFNSQIKKSEQNYNNKNWYNLIYKKYNDIPIIPHDSEKPMISFEEIDGGKYHSIIQISLTNYKDKNDLKIEKKKISNEIPIVSHDSEKPHFVFEEINSFNKNNFNYLFTDYKGKKSNKNTKIKETNIFIHESQKPCIIFEEIDGGKLCSKIKTSNKEKENKNCKKFQEIPITIHNSINPSLVFEESNTGIRMFLNHKKNFY